MITFWQASPDRVTQRGILNVELPDHQLIQCTRKISRIKRGDHKQIKFRSFKNYTIHGCEKALVEINFPEYKNFDNVNDAYSNLIKKLMEVIGKVAPVKNKRIKKNSQEWFDSEVLEKIIIREKLFKGTLLGLRQFLTTESPLKMMKNAFYLTLKALFIFKIFKFLS